MSQQKEMSFKEFRQRFQTEEACEEYLFQQRWPDSFVCPKCGGIGCQRQFEIVRKRRTNFVIFRRGGVTKSGASLFKKRVHNLLFLAHKFLALLQTVGLALNVDDGAVMQNAVQNGGGDERPRSTGRRSCWR